MVPMEIPLQRVKLPKVLFPMCASTLYITERKLAPVSSHLGLKVLAAIFLFPSGSIPPFSSSPVAKMVKNLPARRETQVQYLVWEDSLEKGMATHFSILAWRIPWTEEPGKLQSMGSQRAGHDWVLTLSVLCPFSYESSFSRIFFSFLEEHNKNTNNHFSF